MPFARVLKKVIPSASSTKHFGYPVFVETKQIQLVQIPITGEELHQSVLLHPRYTPKTMKGIRLIEVTGYKRGRTIDIMLDKPIIFEGKPYCVLNVKGVGANADYEMMIHPKNWFITNNRGETEGCWEENADIFHRIWGVVASKDGTDEFRAAEFKTLGIPHVPHLAFNKLPPKLVSHISNVIGGMLPGLAQLSRVCNTNIRLCDIHRSGHIHSMMKGVNLFELFSDIDARVILAQLSLASDGKMLFLNGGVRENRLIDGQLLDTENYEIGTYKMDASVGLIMEILNANNHALGCTYRDKRRYLRLLQKKTGLPVYDRHIRDGIRLKDILLEKFTDVTDPLLKLARQTA